MDPLGETSLADDGWKVFGNVFGPDWSYWYGYGTFDAPNQTAGFCSVGEGEGGPDQGSQQLVVYSDYLNDNHWDDTDAIIEANVFQERVVTNADIGTKWDFVFDAKRGDIAGNTTALAFIKTIDPNSGWALTNFILLNTTSIPYEWDTYSLSIFIDASLEGQFLQFGFLSQASNVEYSGMFYDNIRFSQDPTISVGFDVKPRSCPNPVNAKSRGVVPAAVLGSADFDVNDIDLSSLQLEGVAPYMWSYEDVGGSFGGDLCGCSASGADGYDDLAIKFDTQELVDAIGPSEGGEIALTLTGSLLDGTPIEGQDCIVFVGGNRPIVIMEDEAAGFGVFGESENSGTTALRNSPWKPRSKQSPARKR
ncbi:MAG: hypothetical protein GTO30_17445 [Acidobacteria bacterium]|nr:hypothetical protein [Acidobacteriota bacterium]NIM63352.1 hypothetical protein [Acidobacteriota bacterium]NIO60091.1 hypothetical protein [Acidobacteriota bacterium]NIQ86784.1 hypothetical protein [Acidobacteriota bacterium]NIT12123.1 hypothetical protein [Acidobacteriota bacterium]